jgi:hypothetical protein
MLLVSGIDTTHVLIWIKFGKEGTESEPRHIED